MCSLEISKRACGVDIQNPDTIVTESYQEFLKILDKI
jgi:hypothetical protein